MTALSHQIALNVFQEALLIFGEWSGAAMAYSLTETEQVGQDSIAEAKTLVKWPLSNSHNLPSDAIRPLRLVFDVIELDQGQDAVHYWPAWAIENTENPRDSRKHYPKIPYPSPQEPAAEQLQALKEEVKAALEKLTTQDWQELSLLMLLLEKYGSYISFGEPDLAFFDLVKTAASVAVALALNPNTQELCLVAGDLSGIQDFIYTISSDGALKSLRARSFTLELVTEEIVQQLLLGLGLPRSNVIYAGGGNLYLLAPAIQSVDQTVKAIRDRFNQWLFKEFQEKVFLGLTASPAFPKTDISDKAFAEHWERAIKDLAIQKSRKFDNQLSDVLSIRPAHEPCKVCHRDDVRTLKPLGGDGVDACSTCNRMFELGRHLFKVGALVRSPSPDSHALDSIKMEVGETPIYYHLFRGAKAIPQEPAAVYLINNWDLDLYKFSHFENPTPLLLGNYGQESQESEEARETFMTAQEMANQGSGIKRVGYLRMDVDKLGQIFVNGLGEHYTLSRLSGLSRQMSYFFKVYLNSLAEFRQRDFLDHVKEQKQQPQPEFRSLTSEDRQDLLFIYAGGDDLFVSGAWNQVVELAFDIYQSFRAFTGWHPDITLSGGISLSGPKYPLYQSADDSGAAETAAKGNGRDSLGLFNQVFKWEEWLGNYDQSAFSLSAIPSETKEYIGEDTALALFGIFPFVHQLRDTLGTRYSRSFIQNLLSTAQLQEQWTKKAQEEQSQQEKAIRYFLHLPRVAYTLARVPVAVKNTEGFDAVRQSLKSPYNAPYFRAIATWLELLNRSTAGIPNNRHNNER
ncbi:MAG: type III-A CRISPR-associated protein Cas10/Csm1 [Leptolyngbya sp. SIOISBB]|nr:type III-A CRISPR-associated protein Cas10/Csm1 [Leptolyngbya sp. SIOISBB]